MAKDKLGSGWDKEHEGRKFISLALDLGIVGEVSCAVFENDRRDPARNHPTHNVIFTPAKGEKAKYVGALWKKTARDGGDYMIGNLKLKEFGTVSLGDMSVDFAKHDAPVDIKVVHAASTGGRGPQYHVFRTTEFEGGREKKEGDAAGDKE